MEEEIKCNKCETEMKKGIAIKNTLVGGDRGTTLSRNGKPILVNVNKCVTCGKSIEA